MGQVSGREGKGNESGVGRDGICNVDAQWATEMKNGNKCLLCLSKKNGE